MNVNIPIERFIPESENILEILYQDTSCNNICGLDQLLELPVNPDYKGDINRFKINVKKDEKESNEKEKES